MSYQSWKEAVGAVYLPEVSVRKWKERPDKPKPGDVWKVPTGYKGVNPEGDQQLYKDEKQAVGYAMGKTPKGEKPPKTIGKPTPPEDGKEPTDTPPEEKPTSKKTKKTTGSGYKGDKDKSIQDVDTSNSSTFTEDIDPSDDDYTPPKTAKGKSFANPVPPPPFEMPEIKSRRFPKKYMKAIERMMNSTKSGDNPITQDFIKGVGAGKAGSQAGEIMSLLATGMDKEEWDVVKKSLLDYESALKKQPGNEHLKSSSARIIDKSWINAADNNRIAIERQVEGMYGKGAKIVNTGWDVEADVEAMGWEGKYKESKGYSTDIYCKVELPDGSVIMHEPSLKKDDKINFINKTTGAFEDWLGGFTDENKHLDPEELSKGEVNRLKTTDKDKIKKVEEMAKKDPLKSYMEKKPKRAAFTLEQVLDPTKGPGSLRHKKKAAFMAMNMMAGTPEYGYQETGPNKGKVLLADPPTPEQEAVLEHIKAVRKYCDDATRSIAEPGTPDKPNELREGMIKAISEEFPLKGVADQEETMAIGANSLDPATMEKIFGTSDFDEIKQDLIVDENPPDGPPHLAYKGGPEGKMLQIATITIRQDGIGYGAPNIKFEMSMDKDFADRLKQANKDVYGNLPEEKVYESLEGTISRMKL